jgi:transposase-like protein
MSLMGPCFRCGSKTIEGGTKELQGSTKWLCLSCYRSFEDLVRNWLWELRERKARESQKL